MNPMEAYKAMQEGNVCKGQKRGNVWKISEFQKLMSKSGDTNWRENPYIDLFMTESFEIVQKYNKLSDMICSFQRDEGVGKDWIRLPTGAVCNPKTFDKKFILLEHVKQKMDEFIKVLKNRLAQPTTGRYDDVLVDSVAKEIIGERLTQL